MNDPLPPTPPNSRVKIRTIPEVAKFLRLSETTVRRMCERKELPAVKFGSQWRIREEDVLATFDQPA
jgi:excisionase family DNA binding protein